MQRALLLGTILVKGSLLSETRICLEISLSAFWDQPQMDAIPEDDVKIILIILVNLYK